MQLCFSLFDACLRAITQRPGKIRTTHKNLRGSPSSPMVLPVRRRQGKALFRSSSISSPTKSGRKLHKLRAIIVVLHWPAKNDCSSCSHLSCSSIKRVNYDQTSFSSLLASLLNPIDHRFRQQQEVCYNNLIAQRCNRCLFLQQSSEQSTFRKTGDGAHYWIHLSLLVGGRLVAELQLAVPLVNELSVGMWL